VKRARLAIYRRALFEDWFDKSGSYDTRFAQFARALRKQYPQYRLISTAP
jgi:alpha-L-arabinofuranosidase